MSLSTIRLLSALLGLCAFASSASAAQSTYLMSINWTSGPLVGTRSAGSLSFDESLAVPNAQYAAPNMLTSFVLTVGDKTYGLADVRTGFLSFDAAGSLRLLGEGTDCGPNYCSAGYENPNSLYIVYDSQSQADRFFGVAGPAGPLQQSYGPGSFVLSPVPEPSSLALFAVGLAGSFLRWRRKPATSRLALGDQAPATAQPGRDL